MTASSCEFAALYRPGPLLISVTSPQPMMPQRMVFIASSVGRSAAAAISAGDCSARPHAWPPLLRRRARRPSPWRRFPRPEIPGRRRSGDCAGRAAARACAASRRNRRTGRECWPDFTLPRTGCSCSTIIPRARICGSASTASMFCTAAFGTSAASSAATHSATVWRDGPGRNVAERFLAIRVAALRAVKSGVGGKRFAADQPGRGASRHR